MGYTSLFRSTSSDIPEITYKPYEKREFFALMQNICAQIAQQKRFRALRYMMSGQKEWRDQYVQEYLFALAYILQEMSLDVVQDMYFSLFEGAVKEHKNVKKLRTAVYYISFEDIHAFLREELSVSDITKWYEICRQDMIDHEKEFTSLFSLIHIPDKEYCVKSMTYFLLILSMLLRHHIS